MMDNKHMTKNVYLVNNCVHYSRHKGIEKTQGRNIALTGT